MEIEAKLSVPDEDSFRRLHGIDRLAGYTVLPGRVEEVEDTYLDTPGGAILTAGFACRRRRRAGRITVTLKALVGAEGAIHRREELEVELREDGPPAQWPASPVRERLAEWGGKGPLVPLFELRQRRDVRLVGAGERVVAELSLDEVTFATAEGEARTFELELELRPGGSEEELVALATCLREEWGLMPEPVSKFERGLALAGLRI
ncbi:MAG TPA: CYTH domain-containing protein [Ardenticatenaceae bacterium]|nr:CYTH domain-containing protein [Ardenticatenaceae bacterium]